MSLPQPLFYQIWEKVDIRKVKADQLTLFLACPVPSVWSPIWKRKHQDTVLTFLAVDTLHFFKFKIKLKSACNGAETVSSVGTGKQF